MRVCDAYRTASDGAMWNTARIVLFGTAGKGIALSLPEKQDECVMLLRKSTREQLQKGNGSNRGINLEGAWTYTLIPCFERWVYRKHRKLTQFLKRHSGYRKYYHRFGLDVRIMSEIRGWKKKVDIPNVSIEGNNLVEEMLRSQVNWSGKRNNGWKRDRRVI